VTVVPEPSVYEPGWSVLVMVWPDGSVAVMVRQDRW